MPHEFPYCKTSTSSPLYLLPLLLELALQNLSPIILCDSTEDKVFTFMPFLCCLIRIQPDLQQSRILLDQMHSEQKEISSEMCFLTPLYVLHLSIYNQLLYRK